ncbi:hypothetical protein ABW20_dc0108009 [Dactylellina cionopaga]|nr:hypothetical protein ABW20_dc0108009 [Dactylellina cionopaga]
MSSKFTEKEIQDLTGYVIIVTGGNSGIGFETAKQLALRNARVYVASRSEERVQKAIEEMCQLANKRLDLHFLQIDLLDLKSVKAAAAKFSAQEERLDILINNAGIMNAPFKLSKDGYETQWQSNYLAPHIFTSSLLPKLIATAALHNDKTRVRVVNVSSDLAFFGPKTINLVDVNLTDYKGLFSLHQRYGHSKQASIRDAAELTTRYASQGVTGYSLHPGVVKSSLQGSDPSFLGKVTRALVRFSPMTTLAATYSTLYTATSPNAPKEGAGKYFSPACKVDARAEKFWADSSLNTELWDRSEETSAQLR